MMAIRSLQHIALAVPDPLKGRTFYTDFGMQARTEARQIVMRCRGRDQDQVILLESKQRHMHHLCFGASAAAIKEITRRLEQHGHKLVDAPREAPAEGIWFHDPDGLLINVRDADPAPWHPAAQWMINNPGHLNRIGTPGHPPRDLPIEPRRLGHTLRFTPDLDRVTAFYTQLLGMKLSDRVPGIIAFLRTGDGGSDHHVLAFLKSDRPGFHHASFEVGNIDEVGVGACRMLGKGYRNGWGFGRHVIGSNFFHYIRDPWGSLAEYFCDIDYIPDGMNWQATDYPPADSLYAWGPNVPDDFGQNFE